MGWVIFRVVLGVVGVVFGIYIALKEGRGKKALGILIILVSVLQGAEKAIELIDYVSEHIVDSTPVGCVVSKDAKTIRVLNSAGDAIWHKTYSSEIYNAHLVDFDNDGEPELVVGIGGRVKECGMIYLYDYEGNLLWSLNTLTKYPYPGGSNKMTVKGLSIEPLTDKSGPRKIVAIAGDINWYQTRIMIIDHRGKVVSQYWNPGQLDGNMIISDLDKDGVSEIIIYGHNNDFRATRYSDKSGINFFSIFLLKMGKISGEAPPYLGAIGSGTHQWHKLVFPQKERISRVELVDKNNDGVVEIAVWLSCGYVYYLNANGKIIGMGMADRYRCDPKTTRLLSIR